MHKTRRELSDYDGLPFLGESSQGRAGRHVLDPEIVHVGVEREGPDHARPERWPQSSHREGTRRERRLCRVFSIVFEPSAEGHGRSALGAFLRRRSYTRGENSRQREILRWAGGQERRIGLGIQVIPGDGTELAGIIRKQVRQQNRGSRYLRGEILGDYREHKQTFLLPENGL